MRARDRPQRRRLAGERGRDARIDDRRGPRRDRARRRNRRNRSEHHAELAARRRTADRRRTRVAVGDRRRGAAGEPAQLILIDLRGDLDRVLARRQRAHGRARDRLAVAVEHAAFDRRRRARARARARRLPGLELDTAGRQVAGRERIGDPAAVRHALDAEHAVVAAARVARRLIVADRPQLDRGDEPGAFVAIDDATDDDRCRLRAAARRA